MELQIEQSQNGVSLRNFAEGDMQSHVLLRAFGLAGSLVH